MRRQASCHARGAARSHMLVACLGWLVTTSACIIDHGAGWQLDEASHGPANSPAAVSFVLLGEPAPGRLARAVAQELERTLTEERKAGRTPLVLWLGNQIAPSCDKESSDPLWDRRGLRELGETMRAHARHGGQSFAILGHRDWRCAPDEIDRLSSAAASAQLWDAPTANVVLRVNAEGRARAVSSCDDGEPQGPRCTLAPPRDSDLVDLVLLDVTPWIFPPEVDSEQERLAKASLSTQEALLNAISTSEGPPRILVSHVPIESAGVRGQGGLRPTATFDRFAPALQAAIVDGAFVGVLSAHERDIEVTADLSDAIKRSSKTWLRSPLFQVVSGSAGAPDQRLPNRKTMPRNQGISLRPDLRSMHPGFAHLLIGTQSVDVIVHARRSGRWARGAVSFPLAAPPHPSQTRAVHQTPCLGCDPKDGAANGRRRDLEDPDYAP